MKYFLFLLINLFFFSLSGADWKSNTYTTVTKKNILMLPDGLIYSNFDQTGLGTSNLGKYTIAKCSGNRLDREGKLVEINVYCEIEVDDGNKYWTKIRRASGDSDSGVSKFTFLGGTNSFDKLKGTECTYAVSYFKNRVFGNSKCKISDELFEELKK